MDTNEILIGCPRCPRDTVATRIGRDAWEWSCDMCGGSGVIEDLHADDGDEIRDN